MQQRIPIRSAIKPITPPEKPIGNENLLPIKTFPKKPKKSKRNQRRDERTMKLLDNVDKKCGDELREAERLLVLDKHSDIPATNLEIAMRGDEGSVMYRATPFGRTECLKNAYGLSSIAEKIIFDEFCPKVRSFHANGQRCALVILIGEYPSVLCVIRLEKNIKEIATGEEGEHILKMIATYDMTKEMMILYANSISGNLRINLIQW